MQPLASQKKDIRMMNHQETMDTFLELMEAMSCGNGGTISAAVYQWLNNEDTDLSIPRLIIANRYKVMPKITRTFLNQPTMLAKYSKNHLESLRTENSIEDPSKNDEYVRFYAHMQYVQKVLQSGFSPLKTRRIATNPPKVAPKDINRFPQYQPFRDVYKNGENKYEQKLSPEKRKEREQFHKYINFIEYCLSEFASSLPYYEAIEFFVDVTVNWAMTLPTESILKYYTKEHQFDDVSLSKAALDVNMGWYDYNSFSEDVPSNVFVYLWDEYWE